MSDEIVALNKEIWHSLSVDDAIRKLEVNIATGLSLDEAQKRRDRYGLNQITPKKGTPL